MKKMTAAMIVMTMAFSNVFAAQGATTDVKPQVKLSVEQKIGELQKQNIVAGYGNGDLGLKKQLTHAELIKMIVASINGAENEVKQLAQEPSAFSDMGVNHWANGYINYANKRYMEEHHVPLVSGYPDGTFKPNQPVTNAELLKVLVVFGKKDLKPDQVKNAAWPMAWNDWAVEMGIIDKESGIHVDNLNAPAIRQNAFTSLYNTNEVIAKAKKEAVNIKEEAKKKNVVRRYGGGGGSSSHHHSSHKGSSSQNNVEKQKNPVVVNKPDDPKKTDKPSTGEQPSEPGNTGGGSTVTPAPSETVNVYIDFIEFEDRDDLLDAGAFSGQIGQALNTFKHCEGDTCTGKTWAEVSKIFPQNVEVWKLYKTLPDGRMGYVEYRSLEELGKVIITKDYLVHDENEEGNLYIKIEPVKAEVQPVGLETPVAELKKAPEIVFNADSAEFTLKEPTNQDALAWLNALEQGNATVVANPYPSLQKEKFNLTHAAASGSEHSYYVDKNAHKVGFDVKTGATVKFKVDGYKGLNILTTDEGHISSVADKGRDDDYEQPVNEKKVKSVRINLPSQLSLHAGEGLDLTATVKGENLTETDKKVNWTLKNPVDGVSINAEGQLTTSENTPTGEIVIVATAGEQKDELTLNVEGKVVLEKKVTGVTITAPEKTTLTVGESLRLEATVQGENLGTEDKTVTWSIEGEAHGVTINPNGDIDTTQATAGTITVVATAGDKKATQEIILEAKAIETSEIKVPQVEDWSAIENKDSWNNEGFHVSELEIPMKNVKKYQEWIQEVDKNKNKLKVEISLNDRVYHFNALSNKLSDISSDVANYKFTSEFNSCTFYFPQTYNGKSLKGAESATIKITVPNMKPYVLTVKNGKVVAVSEEGKAPGTENKKPEKKITGVTIAAPSKTTLTVGESLRLEATVQGENLGAEDKTVTWSIEGDAHGATINAEIGELTTTNATAGTITVVATAGDKKATQEITLEAKAAPPAEEENLKEPPAFTTKNDGKIDFSIKDDGDSTALTAWWNNSFTVSTPDGPLKAVAFDDYSTPAYRKVDILHEIVVYNVRDKDVTIHVDGYKDIVVHVNASGHVEKPVALMIINFQR